MKILYLENHAIFADQVTSKFLSAHAVKIVPSLSGARAAFSKESFDMVLCDYDLDDGKGDEFVSECRMANPRLPIIAVSSHADGNAALLTAGASAVCEKMNFDKIGVVIDKIIQG